MKTLERIQWSYYHWLNGRSKTTITKKGIYYGKVKHTQRHWQNFGAVQMAIVRFDGNKRHSKIPYDELKVSK